MCVHATRACPPSVGVAQLYMHKARTDLRRQTTDRGRCALSTRDPRCTTTHTAWAWAMGSATRLARATVHNDARCVGVRHGIRAGPCRVGGCAFAPIVMRRWQAPDAHRSVHAGCGGRGSGGGMQLGCMNLSLRRVVLRELPMGFRQLLRSLPARTGWAVGRLWAQRSVTRRRSERPRWRRP